MARRILLISANRCATPDAVFPLSLAHLTAALRQAGHECLWLDCLADAPHFAERLQNARPDLVGISLRNIDDVLIRKQETFFGDLISLGAAVRRQLQCPIVVGGSGFSIFPERLLELSGADFGIAGEGETGLLALLDALDRKEDYSRIPGLVYRHGGKIIANPGAAAPLDRPLADTDRPAAIARHYLDISGVLNLQTQRGCSFRCCYCTYPLIEGKHHRRRPPELVADEFEQLQRLGARYAFIVDSVFNSSPHHVTEICEAMLRRNLKMSWGCFLRPQGLTPALMQLMARAGLSHIEFGSDSFCDETLAAYHKGFTFADVLHSSDLARQAKIEYCHFLIAGGPGETTATLQTGFENSRQLTGAVIMAVVGMRIYPATQLFERAVAEGHIRADTDLLPPAYYLSPELTEAGVFAQLEDFARRSPSWIVGDPVPGYTNLIGRLRQRGVIGPLWSYFSLAQRLWPQGASPAPTL